ncbi:hypothetical protein EV693_105103 [Nicoletella semolina]|uniref:Uncharacterized protein n=2 Tax=Nicoletella semolina TaxID=271160 RepID=A0A4R2N9E5_9PAST|nr:hypothetical protein EV693_105103 [Nicoletella semolina]
MHNDVSITIHIDNQGNVKNSPEQTAQQAKQLAQLIQAQVLDVLSKQQRSGGLLAH